METVIMVSCFQANVLISNIGSQKLSLQVKRELVEQIKDVAPKTCKWDNFPLDANVEPKERTNTHTVKEQTNGINSN